ncbi:MAG TPA: hypothetical protein VKR59_17765 [Terriglobales bacterium]|jgi:hypothetical protein|nr:hypothetical protein [Terriglobales bacterium]
MSASPRSAPHSDPRSRQRLPRDPDVVGELLHSLSQPLTGLLCSLELSLHLPAGLSLEEIVEQRRESVAAALQQTEKVIALVQSLRDYLDPC